MPADVQTMFSTGGIVPWHGQGVKLPEEAITAAEAIKHAGLDWSVSIHQYGAMIDGQYIVDPGSYFTQRDDQPFPQGRLGKGLSEIYHPVQNRDLFTFFDPVVERGEAIYHTGGVLKNGEIVWLLAKLPRDLYLPGVPDEAIENFLLLSSSHDGSMAITIKPTRVRVVCRNTLSAALDDGEATFYVTHRSGAEEALKYAHLSLGLVTKQNELLVQAYEKLLKIKATSRRLTRFLRFLFPSKPEEEDDGEPSAVTESKRNTVIALMSAPTNAMTGMRSTAYAVYQATVEFLDHYWDARKGTDRLYRTWFGSAAELKAKAFRYLLEDFE